MPKCRCAIMPHQPLTAHQKVPHPMPVVICVSNNLVPAMPVIGARLPAKRLLCVLQVVAIPKMIRQYPNLLFNVKSKPRNKQGFTFTLSRKQVVCKSRYWSACNAGHVVIFWLVSTKVLNVPVSTNQRVWDPNYSPTKLIAVPGTMTSALHRPIRSNLPSPTSSEDMYSATTSALVV